VLLGVIHGLSRLNPPPGRAALLRSLRAWRGDFFCNCNLPQFSASYLGQFAVRFAGNNRNFHENQRLMMNFQSEPRKSAGAAKGTKEVLQPLAIQFHLSASNFLLFRFVKEQARERRTEGILTRANGNASAKSGCRSRFVETLRPEMRAQRRSAGVARPVSLRLV
jgi:hypothetical protein